MKKNNIKDICANCGHLKKEHISNESGCLHYNKVLSKIQVIYCPCQQFEKIKFIDGKKVK